MKEEKRLHEASIILSLLGGKCKSASQIAREWHHTGTPPDTVFREKCKFLANSGKLRCRNKYKKGESAAKEYSLNVEVMHKLLADSWGIKPSETLKVLNLDSFKKFTNNFIPDILKKSALEILVDFCKLYFEEVMISDGLEKEKELIRNINLELDKKIPNISKKYL